jgi:7,8-dihydropterin-6-yl-methyl-4-(beta-D-ribofuranosyl)aminobenzene 5'-phosphate synthase
MKIRRYFPLFCLLFISILISAQSDKIAVTQAELDEMDSALKADTNLARLVSWFGDPAQLYQSYKENKARADSVWENDQQTLTRLRNLGSTKHFEMLPLIDWFTANDSLLGEPGVAYLIRTDEATILFDLGLNANDTDPSPLLQNMEKLGVSPDEIDMIVISHNHDDHVGGSRWSRQNSFSLTNYQPELKPIPVYTPVEMNYPGLTPVYSQKPVEIAEGVATIGVIYNPVFFTDIAEQALAVNVKDKGIVIISGCGHQSLIKIIDRAAILFDEPIYAVLGGLHYPVAEGRNIQWFYKYVVADKLPWEDFTVEDVQNNIGLLKSKHVELVGLSAHDSSDESIEAFKEAFGNAYVDILVGQKIIISN